MREGKNRRHRPLHHQPNKQASKAHKSNRLPIATKVSCRSQTHQQFRNKPLLLDVDTTGATRQQREGQLSQQCSTLALGSVLAVEGRCQMADYAAMSGFQDFVSPTYWRGLFIRMKFCVWATVFFSVRLWVNVDTGTASSHSLQL